jgi:hypothetical protein
MSGLDNWIAAQPEPRPSRVEAIRRLIERGLAPAPAPSEDIDELRRQFLRLAKRVDEVVAQHGEGVSPRLGVVSRPGEQFAVRQPPREPPAVTIQGATPRCDPEAVARARAQLAAAEEAARRREELRSE